MSTATPTLGPVFDIPDFTISGVLPPFQGSKPTVPSLMSPYPTSLVRIANRLCASDKRKEIFRGLLTYRQQLSISGLGTGFQWLSGSFLEDIENLESRDPRDVDVITFCYRPVAVADDVAWQGFLVSNAALVEPNLVKAAYLCDAYFVDLNIEPSSIVDQTRYWFGLFSHRRGGLWKGMLQIPLSVTADDTDASEIVRS
jgi:hypothetical protein